MKFEILQKTPLFSALSELGKRIFLPDGIFYWSGRAKKKAELIGTIGTAFGFEKDFIDGSSDEWLPCYLQYFKEYSSLNIKSIVPYASIGGLADIRNIWKKWVVKKSYLDKEKENEKIELLEKSVTQPIVTQGITNGIFLSCSLFLSPGEFIISPNKRWGNYDNIINKFIGAKIKSFEYFKEQQINVQGLRDAVIEVAKEQEKIVLILNFPNNPTGYVPTQEEVEKILKVLKDTQESLRKTIIVLVDDAYEPYIYNNDVVQRSIFYDLVELEEDVVPVKLDGISKELLAYGGRVGFVTIGLKPSWVKSDAELETLKIELNNKLEGINRSTISNTNHFYQAVTQKMFLEKGMDQIIAAREKVRLLLKDRYDLINRELLKIDNPDISIDPNSGGFFVFINIDPNKIKATEFADHLLKNYQVGVIPIEKISDQINGIRIAYCSIDINNIQEFVKRINLALKDF